MPQSPNSASATSPRGAQKFGDRVSVLGGPEDEFVRFRLAAWGNAFRYAPIW
jgi:hypothetical protein